MQQFHPPADSVGDVLGFHNPVFNAADTQQIARDNGYCVHTVVTGQTEWECNFTTMLAAGNITVEGEFFDNGTDSTLAITGGTGKYAGAARLDAAPCHRRSRRNRVRLHLHADRLTIEEPSVHIVRRGLPVRREIGSANTR